MNKENYVSLSTMIDAESKYYEDGLVAGTCQSALTLLNWKYADIATRLLDNHGITKDMALEADVAAWAVEALDRAGCFECGYDKGHSGMVAGWRCANVE